MTLASAPPSVPATESVQSVLPPEAASSSGVPSADLNTRPEQAKGSHHPHPDSTQAFRRGVQSVFAVSFALFVCLNLCCSYAQPIAFDAYKFIYPGWAWWTFHDLKQNPDIHNVALLGSSLMVRATNDCDANFLRKQLDLTVYHKATYFDTLLKNQFGGRFNTYNLAAPGQMPSDAFFTLKAMVNTSERPDVVVYGVAPRDFIDSTLSSPVDTEHFHYLTRLVNVDDVAPKLFRSPISKFDFWLQHASYFYGNSLNFQMGFTDSINEAMATAVPTPAGGHPFTYWDRVHMLPKYLPGEIKPRAVIISPIDMATAKKNFTDSTREYYERYRRPDPHIYKTQFYFLKALSDYCHREKMELILVNMPITRLNVALLKPVWYISYLQALKEFSIYNNVQLFNLSNFDAYPQVYFHDSVHLNAFGGKKFFDNLVSCINSSKRTKTAMELAGKSLERQEFLAKSNHVETQ